MNLPSPDLLEHKTLGYKGEQQPFLEEVEREDDNNPFLERETLRNLDFLEDSP